MNNRSEVKCCATESKYSLMEKKFHEEFSKLRKKETSVRRGWCTLRGRQILHDLYPETEFKFSWCARGGSGLDKRQCTAQLTIFVGGIVLSPLLIFRGEGKRIEIDEMHR